MDNGHSAPLTTLTTPSAEQLATWLEQAGWPEVAAAVRDPASQFGQLWRTSDHELRAAMLGVLLEQSWEKRGLQDGSQRLVSRRERKVRLVPPCTQPSELGLTQDGGQLASRRGRELAWWPPG
jgi:hypothetical protein